jgi:hypothetical protein
LLLCDGKISNKKNKKLRVRVAVVGEKPTLKHGLFCLFFNLIIYYMSNNTDIINNTLTKSVIAGVLAGAADYNFGRFGLPTALKFGAAVGVGVAVVSLLQLPAKSPNTTENKTIKFVVTRIPETLTGATLAFLVDSSSWSRYAEMFPSSAPYKFEANRFHRLGYIFAADVVAAVVVESMASNSLFK